MKTLHDYLKAMCGNDYSSPLYIMPESPFEPIRFTTCGCMLYISIKMLIGGRVLMKVSIKTITNRILL